MYYDALQTFITVVEQRNFTKAAEILLLSQPSVSLHIKNLEKEFDSQLLIRTSKSLSVTPTGQMLYERAKQIVQLYEQTKKEIHEYHHYLYGQLKIGASFTIGEYVLPAILAKIHQDHPDLELEVTIGNTEEIVEQVRLFQIDVGLIEGQTNDKEVLVTSFQEDKLVVVAHPSHLLAKAKELIVLDQQSWITRERGSGTREFFYHVLRSNGLKAKSVITISSNQGIKEAILNNMGISLLSESVVKREVEQGSLVIIDTRGEQFLRKFSFLVSPVKQTNKAVDMFIKQIQK
ncbi:LysR family transcriptional regulator [Bacillus alkalicellulosilyticus]|uniref:LysR family transcriptional regulator n=1 Tax=Alkalihalobacterium alkalicellulosilyticum TaxID=1912214 RepID=UPI000996A65A|nr:LysR family transcriptional regulator [Bacillus alkalicellulosilyticus]